MSMTTSHAQPPKFTGKHMLFIMIAFFGVIIAVNFTMAYMASHTWTGLIVKNTYVASQEYNDTLAAAERQHALGLRSKISYHQDTLVFMVKDADGNRVRIEDPVLEIGRPAFEQADRKLQFLPANNFSNRLLIKLDPGTWALTITGTVDGEPYRRDARLFVDNKNKGTIK